MKFYKFLFSLFNYIVIAFGEIHLWLYLMIYKLSNDFLLYKPSAC